METQFLLIGLSHNLVRILKYSIVSARRLLFVWCSLSDNRQTIFRCLSYVPSDICQLPPDICQTSTTYTPGRYHAPTRHMVYDVWCILVCGTCLTDVWWHLTDVWWGIWQTSDNHLTGSTRQIATVWPKRWCREIIFFPFV